jgi:hypothetical protein
VPVTFASTQAGHDRLLTIAVLGRVTSCLANQTTALWRCSKPLEALAVRGSAMARPFMTGELVPWFPLFKSAPLFLDTNNEQQRLLRPFKGMWRDARARMATFEPQLHVAWQKRERNNKTSTLNYNKAWTGCLHIVDGGCHGRSDSGKWWSRLRRRCCCRYV